VCHQATSIAGQRRAPARNFSTSRAASSRKSQKNRCPPPLKPPKIRTSAYIRENSYIFSAVGGLWPKPHNMATWCRCCGMYICGSSSRSRLRRLLSPPVPPCGPVGCGAGAGTGAGARAGARAPVVELVVVAVVVLLCGPVRSNISGVAVALIAPSPMPGPYMRWLVAMCMWLRPCERQAPRGRFDFVWPVYALTSARPGAGSNSTAPASRAPRVAPSHLKLGPKRRHGFARSLVDLRN
jgi:hypothetical protein